MGAADGVTVGLAVAVAEQFLGGEPVVEFDALEAAAVDPEMIGLMLDLGLAGLVLGWGQRRFIHDMALVRLRLL